MPSSPAASTLFPYTTLFRSHRGQRVFGHLVADRIEFDADWYALARRRGHSRSEEHTSELQSLRHLVCRLHRPRLHSFPTRRSSDLTVASVSLVISSRTE